ncbi:RNA polymerase sigma-70 factor [Streptomyces iranensis]|uniref:RNA polymerase sigma-70 factor (ECF subfamily) n=1 Tax=Streptomyces iranensis TaxID=576784 RepID=A0A060ZTH0_9ACTN|nr:RNA polymerase sigma-70 factor [Streptomyces iranensis]MBP2060885.1 RNA polymerase sigma-70 factor (ECF subfamily) [Streptomyces iranensis]CDR06347.1 RNA polymerase, sigma-24 subunit, ECF subfamily [Streptomyces iranensis]
MIDTTTFEEHRRMLFGIAYRMLGSVADAEDVVQDAWLRCSQVSTPVENPAGYLARTVTNLALNRLTSAAATREQYVGPWLPEPLVTRPDVGEEVELAESVSLAMLVVLESLSPLERAVFVLKDVFGFSFREIAGMLDRGEAAVRQVGSRARAHVQARRPRYDAPAEVRRRVTEEFLAACLGGDLNRMMELLAPDVTAWSDGGGKVKAALRPQQGAEKVARFLAAVIAQPMDDPRVHAVDVNGRPGLLLTVAGRPDTVACAEVEDGRITEIRIIRNPEKLRHLPSP